MVTTAKKPQAKRDVRKIEYDGVSLVLYSDRKGGDEPALSRAKAELMLGWVDETKHLANEKAKNPKVKEEKCQFGEDYDLKDEDGNKVRLLRNKGNRPLDIAWCRVMCQDILNGNWKLNLETIIVSKFATILSGQHRLVAFIFAVQKWNQEKYASTGKWRDIWPKEPTLEVAVGFGAEEDEETKRTLDNVKTRVLSDVIYTSGLIQKYWGKGATEDLKTKTTATLSKALSKAVDFIYHRVSGKDHYGLRSHSTSMQFIENHVSLFKSLKTIFELDKGTALSAGDSYGVSPGQCVAMLYLMGVSATNPDDYYTHDPLPMESACDLELWDKAETFFTLLSKAVKEKNSNVAGVLLAIKDVEDEDTEHTATLEERLAVLSKAWTVFVEKEKVRLSDIQLKPEDYSEKDNKTLLKEIPSVGGIDKGEVLVKEGAGNPEILTPEQLEAEKEEARRLRTEKLDKNAKGVDEEEPLPNSDEFDDENLHDDEETEEVEE